METAYTPLGPRVTRVAWSPSTVRAPTSTRRAARVSHSTCTADRVRLHMLSENLMRPQFARRRHRASMILDAIGAAFPDAWQAAEQLRARRASWPTWCYVPAAEIEKHARGAGPPAIAPERRAPILASLASWRMTQGIYRLEPGTAHAGTAHAGAGPPALPEWCVYIDQAGDWHGRSYVGAWVYREPTEWRALIDCAREPPDYALEPVALDPCGSSDLARSARALASGRIVGKGAPGNPRPVRSAGAWRLYHARGPRFWCVTGADHA